MSDYFNCKLCDKSIKIKCKKKHLSSRGHEFLTESIIFRYSIENPDFHNMEIILKNYVLDYNKNLNFYNYMQMVFTLL